MDPTITFIMPKLPNLNAWCCCCCCWWWLCCDPWPLWHRGGGSGLRGQWDHHEWWGADPADDDGEGEDDHRGGGSRTGRRTLTQPPSWSQPWWHKHLLTKTLIAAGLLIFLDSLWCFLFFCKLMTLFSSLETFSRACLPCLYLYKSLAPFYFITRAYSFLLQMCFCFSKHCPVSQLR